MPAAEASDVSESEFMEEEVKWGGGGAVGYEGSWKGSWQSRWRDRGAPAQPLKAVGSGPPHDVSSFISLASSAAESGETSLRRRD